MKLLLPCASAGINQSAMRPSRFTTLSAAFDQTSRPIARTLRAAAACALASAAISGYTAGEKTPFPERPVRWIVPFPASGSIDLVARVLGPNLYASWGQQLVVDNRPGAGGRLGAQVATAAQPDGYTQLFSLNMTYTIDRSLFKHLNYDPDKAFIPVTLVASTSQLLITNSMVPVKNVQELIAYCKSRPREMNYGSSGVGGSLHLAMEYFKSITGIDIVHVPYKGGPPAVADLMAGQISVMFFNTPAAVPYVKSGKLRALGVSVAHRSPLLPEIPTIAESGVPDFDVSVWFGLSVPAGTPPAVVNKTYDAVTRALRTPEVVKQLLDLGAEPGGETPHEFSRRIKAESTAWSQVFKKSNMQLD
jgi:tripartite-type tricarboxylate transporter receptor subunit TctC